MGEATKEGMVFDGWWSKDGSADGDWGVEVTSSDICHGEVVAYAKFKQPYTVTLDWNGATGPAIEAKPVKVAFLTDFYNWCVKQNAFAAADMSLEAFIGVDDAGAYTFKGKWVQYTGATFDSAEFGLDTATMKNLFVAQFGAKPEVIAENNTHFINDAEMYAKWANLMQWLETNVDKNERQWNKIDGYLLCGLGRWMVGVSTGAALKDTIPTGEGFDYATIGQVRTDKEEFTVYSLISDNELPVPTTPGGKFKGWTDGTNLYTAVTEAELSGKTLTPVFAFIEITGDAVAEYEIGCYSNSGLAKGIYLCDTGVTKNNSLRWQYKVLLVKDDAGYKVVAVDAAKASANNAASAAGVTWTHAIASATIKVNESFTVGQYLIIDGAYNLGDGEVTAKIYEGSQVTIK